MAQPEPKVEPDLVEKSTLIRPGLTDQKSCDFGYLERLNP